MIIYGAKPKKNQGFLPSRPKRDEGGNVLIFILIAIILLGALTMTLMRSGQSTSDTADFERLSVQASEILRYASGLELAVKSLRNRGCSENELSFWNDSNSDNTEDALDNYYNSNAPTDQSCHIFESAGAGLTPLTVDTDWLDSGDSAKANFGEPVYTGRHRHQTSGCHSASANCYDLIFYIPYMRDDICNEINRRSDISAVSGEPPSTNVHLDARAKTTLFFTGSFEVGQNITNTTFDYKKTACLKDDTGAGPTSETAIFYQILLAR